MIFNRKKDEEVDNELENEELEDPKQRKIKDLKPENKKTRKEPVKPWGKFERLFVFLTLILTVGLSGILALSARNFKLPNLPRIEIPDVADLNPFKEEIIIVGNKGSKVDTQKIEDTKNAFIEITDGYSGMYAFYIYDINGDYFYGYNYKEKMQAASLIKLPVMYLTLNNISQGLLDKNSNLTYVESMGKRSDNNAYLKMLGVLGRETVSRAIYELGMSNTSLAENITTPEDVGMFLKKLYKKEILDAEYSDLFLEYLTNTSFENWLRLGVPNEYKLAHKYGREVHSVSDAGVVLSDKPFVIVIMTDGVIEKEADQLFPKIAKLLYDKHTGIEVSE